MFPDDEALVQAEFANTVDFSMGLARSAHDPDDPSPVGDETEPFYLDQAEVDDENSPLSMFDFTFDVSYGDPQEVRVLAKRDLGPVTVKFRINGGDVQSAPTTEWTGGERYGVGSATWPPRHERAGHRQTGQHGGGVVRSGRRAQRLVHVHGRVGDRQPAPPPPPRTTPAPHPSTPTRPSRRSCPSTPTHSTPTTWRTTCTTSTPTAGRPPRALGVLSHDAVVWYTGNDIITREPGWAGGNASSLAISELFEVRDFINEGGRVLYTGKFAGHQYTPAHGSQLYDPFDNAQCSSDPAIEALCRPLNGSGDLVGDVLEYWFGAGILVDNAGTDPETGNLFDVIGVDNPLTRAVVGVQQADSAQNQDHSASFITTSGLLPVADFPQFELLVAGRYDRPGGPFDPHSGSQYVYSQIADISYKRLTRTITVPSGGASLSFWVSHDTEVEWDHFFVEARTPGQEDWTTLPDANLHTTQSTGQSCPEGWRNCIRTSITTRR